MDLHYQQLSESALDVLDKHEEARSAFLDYLTLLQDLLASQSEPEEPSFFSLEEVEKAYKEILRILPAKELRPTAAANWERAQELRGSRSKDIRSFLDGLYAEYHAVRMMRCRDGEMQAA